MERDTAQVLVFVMMATTFLEMDAALLELKRLDGHVLVVIPLHLTLVVKSEEMEKDLTLTLLTVTMEIPFLGMDVATVEPRRQDGHVQEEQLPLLIHALKSVEMAKGIIQHLLTVTMATMFLEMGAVLVEQKRLAGHALVVQPQYLILVVKSEETEKGSTH